MTQHRAGLVRRGPPPARHRSRPNGSIISAILLFLKKSNEMSEDELFAAQEEVQKLTDKNIEKVDKIAIGKEKEIMEL